MSPLPTYANYGEISPIIRDYFLTISGESDIMNVSLEDINGYLKDNERDYTEYLVVPIPDGELDESMDN